MGKLMKAEFYKLQKFPSVRLIFLFILAVGMLRGFSPYSGYQVYTIGLVPELFDIVLVSVFTSAFLCTEFSRRTFGNSVLCGTSIGCLHICCNHEKRFWCGPGCPGFGDDR